MYRMRFYTIFMFLFLLPVCLVAKDWRKELNGKIFSFVGYYTFENNKFSKDKVWLGKQGMSADELKDESHIRLAQIYSISGEYFFALKKTKRSILSNRTLTIGVQNGKVNIKHLLDLEKDYYVTHQDLISYFDGRYKTLKAYSKEAIEADYKLFLESKEHQKANVAKSIALKCSPKGNTQNIDRLTQILSEMLSNKNNTVKYWAAIGLSKMGVHAKPLLGKLKEEEKKFVNDCHSKSPLSAIQRAIKNIEATK